MYNRGESLYVYTFRTKVGKIAHVYAHSEVEAFEKYAEMFGDTEKPILVSRSPW